MATIVYRGSVSSSTGLNQTPSISLSGSGSASGVINSVTALLTFSTNAYGTTYNVTATLFYSGGSQSSTVAVKMNSSNYSNGQFSFEFVGLTADQANSISSITVSCANDSSKIFLKGAQTVTVDYMVVSEVKAPTAVSLSAESAAPGATVTLSWSGATAGDNNNITGYEVYRATSPGGAYSLLTTVGSSNATSGATHVTAPTTNGESYYFTVKTIGSVSGYNSDMSVASATLTCSFETVGGVTSVRLDVTNAAPGATATLSWSGATPGVNNPISEYDVYRNRVSPDSYEDWEYIATVSADVTSTNVTAPTTLGEVYYFTVDVVGTISGSYAESSAYASLTCTYSSPNAPTTVTVGGQAFMYAKPGTTLTLAWSGASSGANNPIKGYKVYRDDTLYADNLSASTNSLSVTAHNTTGNSYRFTVVTVGAYSNSSSSVAVMVHSYTDPVAPTTLTVSDDEPPANGRVTLAWSGAAPGGYNDIVGYRVYRSATETGARTQVAHVASTDTHASCYVTAPSTVGGYYYFWVETIGSYSISGASSTTVFVLAGEMDEDEGDDTSVVVPSPGRRKKRGFVFGDYDTAVNGWTLTGWEFPEPDAQTNYVTIPGRSAGPLDMSTALTNGDPRYGNRELTALFECSEGTRSDRIEVISEMVNSLHGTQVEIVFPDDDTRYAVGRLSVRNDYNDMAHAEVTVLAVCEPWRYSKQETQVSLMAVDEESVAVLSNAGRRVLVPDVTVTGTNASVRLSNGERSWDLSAGTYRLPGLLLRTGNTFLRYSGLGTVVIKYREAIL